MDAVEIRNFDAVRSLINQGAPIFFTDNHGNTIIHQVIEQSEERSQQCLIVLLVH